MPCLSLTVPGVSCCQAAPCSFQRICSNKRTLSKEVVDEPWCFRRLKRDWEGPSDRSEGGQSKTSGTPTHRCLRMRINKLARNPGRIIPFC